MKLNLELKLEKKIQMKNSPKFMKERIQII